MDWDPTQYGLFREERLRPGLDLITRIPLEAPSRIVDLGCGTFEVTVHLVRRWSMAAVLGVDRSEAMLERVPTRDQERRYFQDLRLIPQMARSQSNRVTWLKVDIADWVPPAGGAPDLISSNAALHWLPDHATLFPRLLGYLAPGGCLAVQMPQSWVLPSHRLMRETLAEGGVGGAPLGPASLREQMARRPVGDASDYQALLAPLCRYVDIWEAVYMQILTGEDPVLEWVKGSALRPILEGLEPADRRRFVDIYRERLRVAYPARADGGVPFPFPRLFIVATV